MSFKDENEVLTGVPLGHTAFTATERPASKKRYRGTRPTRSKKEVMLSALASDEEKEQKRRAFYQDRSAAQTKVVAKAKAKNAGFGTLHGLSKQADERIAAHKAREKAITARKPAGAFNTPIATKAESDRTNSIKGRM